MCIWKFLFDEKIVLLLILMQFYASMMRLPLRENSSLQMRTNLCEKSIKDFIPNKNELLSRQIWDRKPTWKLAWKTARVWDISDIRVLIFKRVYEHLTPDKTYIMQSFQHTSRFDICRNPTGRSYRLLL